MDRKSTVLFTYRFSDFSFPAHFHDSLEVIAVRRGEIVLRRDRETYVVHAGEIAVVFPSFVHSYERTDIGENEGEVILIGSRLFGEYREDLTAMDMARPVSRLSKLHPDCAHAIDTLLSEEGGIRLQKAYTRLFLCRFMESAELIPRNRSHENLLYSLVDYMGTHFREDLSLSSVAEALFVSKYTLSGVFSKSLNMNFNDYLNSLRINLAMQLMEGSDRTITDICYEAGFGNVRTFNRAFMKQCGITPSEYRQTIRHTL